MFLMPGTRARPPARKVAYRQEFLASGVWRKPPGIGPNSMAHIEIWHAGGGASRSATVPSGQNAGGGGAYEAHYLPVSMFGVTETVTIGAGGAANTSTGSGANGGVTSFSTRLIETSTFTAASFSGRGGSTSIAGGGGLGTAPIRVSGGDGGEPSGPSNGQNTQYSGGGGGSATAGTTVAGVAITGGGSGGNASSGTANSGAFPSGGGGAHTVASTTGGSGANGKVRVTVTSAW